jgi:hypothetical protein
MGENRPVGVIETMILRNILLAVIIYLPAIFQPAPRAAQEPYYGLAWAYKPGSDIDLLGVDWFYAWRPVNPVPTATAEFVPMLWDGLPSDQLPAAYNGTILIANEPDNIKQLNITPAEMVRRLDITRAYYPNARLLCCGTLSYHDQWLREFIAAGGKPDAWHVHAYVEGPYDVHTIINQLTVVGEIIDHQTTWVTEYNSMVGSLDDFSLLTTWMEQQPWIARIAPYTNRQPHQNEWWEVSPAIELVSPEGTLTGLGSWYASRIQAARQ